MSRVPRARGRTCEASAILTANLRPDLCALELNTNALNCTFPEHATLFPSGTVLKILSLAHGWEYRAGSALIILLPDLRSFILPTDYELILLNIRADALSYLSVSVGR